MKAPLPMPSHPLLSAHVPMSTYVGFVLLFLLFLSPLLLSSSHVCCWQASVVHSTPHIECPLASFPGHLLSTPSGSSWPSNSHQPQAALHGAFCDAIVLLEVLFLCRTIYCTSWPGQTAKNIVHQSQKEPMGRGGEADLGRWRKDASIVSIITHVPWCGAADSRLLTLGPVYYLSTTSRTKVGHVRRRRSDRLRGGASKNPVFPYNRESANVFSSKKLSKIHSLWPLQTA